MRGNYFALPLLPPQSTKFQSTLCPPLQQQHWKKLNEFFFFLAETTLLLGARHKCVHTNCKYRTTVVLEKHTQVQMVSDQQRQEPALKLLPVSKVSSMYIVQVTKFNMCAWEHFSVMPVRHILVWLHNKLIAWQRYPVPNLINMDYGWPGPNSGHGANKRRYIIWYSWINFTESSFSQFLAQR